MDTRRILLGDWHPLLRDGIDVLRLALVVGAVVAGIAGDAHALAYLTVASAIALAVRPLDLPRPYDLSLVLACCLQGFGEAFGLYDRFAWFDSVVHFTIPMLGAPVIYIALARADVVPDPRDDTERRHHVGIFVITFALGAAIGAVWELCEWASDHRLAAAALQRRHGRRPARRHARRGDRGGAARGVGRARVGLRAPDPGREPLRGDGGARKRQFCAPPTPRRRSWKSGGFSTIWLKRTTVTVSSTETSRP